MRRAFTLIELLVTISVIGLLVGILVPALGSARASARRTACASNLRQIGTGLAAYMSANRDRFPHASFMPSIGPAPLEGAKTIRIADVLRVEVGEPEAFRCPNDLSGDRPLSRSNGLTFFQSEGSSYDYRSRLLGGLTAPEVTKLFEQGRRRVGVKVADNAFWIFQDYDNFHAQGGNPGARRYLYSDGHVTDFEN